MNDFSRYFLFIIALLFVMFFPLNSKAEKEEILRGSRFEVVYSGYSREYGDTVLLNCERSYSRISEALGHRISKQVKIILAKSDKQFKILTNWEIPDWGSAVAESDSLIIVTPLPGRKSMISGIIAHEIVHIVIGDAAKEQPVPRWFHEGCAQELSGEWGVRDALYMSWKVSRGKALNFREIQDVFSSGRSDAALAYDQSLLAVKYLLRVNGSHILAKILDNMESGDDFPTSFWKATGLWPSEFEQEYLKSLEKDYGYKSLITLLPGTWTIILIIAVVVYIIKRWRTKSILKKWEDEESGPEIIDFESIRRDPEEIFDEAGIETHEIIDFKTSKRKFSDNDDE